MARVAAAAEHSAEQPRAAEDVAEGLEDVVEGGEVMQAGTLQPGLAEAVVALAGLGVAEHLVGPGGLLEPLGGLGVVGVAIRMALEGELAIGLLDLGLRGVLADAEHLVIVPFSHRSCGTVRRARSLCATKRAAATAAL
jgi:hypothetical protein